MPLRFSTKADTPPNLCMECGVQCRRPKRFCSDGHKEAWLDRKIGTIDARGVTQVYRERQLRGISPEALEFRRKRSIQQVF